ncbi:MAG TPA: GGDEF domain-containing protein [Terriglobales bacterium]|nr:GGDEF domain-containing protein [Terriglobales bacterium]
MATHAAKIHEGGESVLARVSQQLAALEKRDWELWVIVSLTSLLVGVGLLALLFPAAFLKQDNIHFEITVSRQLVLGLFTLLTLLNTYIVTRRVELRRLREKLISSTIQNELVRLQSFTDPLTEIYNRRSLEEMSARFISHAQRLHKPLTFVLIDVDRFKQVNTRFGHLTGDFVLAELAALLKSSVRGSDAVVRYGGDEFLMILANTSAADSGRVVERIRAYLRDWNRAGHLQNFEVGLSIGVAEWTDGRTLDEILDAADQEMYASKSGKPDARQAAAHTAGV